MVADARVCVFVSLVVIDAAMDGVRLEVGVGGGVIVSDTVELGVIEGHVSEIDVPEPD